MAMERAPQAEPSEPPDPLPPKMCMVGLCFGALSDVKWDAYGFWFLDCMNTRWHMCHMRPGEAEWT